MMLSSRPGRQCKDTFFRISRMLPLRATTLKNRFPNVVGPCSAVGIPPLHALQLIAQLKGTNALRLAVDFHFLPGSRKQGQRTLLVLSLGRLQLWRSVF